MGRLARECGCRHLQLPGRWAYYLVPPIVKSIRVSMNTGSERSVTEVELGRSGRTVGMGATLGFCLRASMTPVIVAMF